MCPQERRRSRIPGVPKHREWNALAAQQRLPGASVTRRVGAVVRTAIWRTVVLVACFAQPAFGAGPAADVDGTTA
jgi:hypothetical protein